ncbi:hypothetical protein EJ06DRAFT_478430, partial [Trichodelitschia bisporula]
DPSILNPFPSPLPYPGYADLNASSPQLFKQPPSPTPSNASARSQTGKVKPSPHQSPYLHTQSFQPYYPQGRRSSVSSLHSRHSQHSGSFEPTDEEREKGLCPIPDCGRVFKDLKAHLLTHQDERPEKCPIQSCEYHGKGFARKYDKNRHTLTHYKGTMVCGFCPGSGSAAEKSFNRADVFKRHLTSVHGVEQAPPNSRRKSPTVKKPGFAMTSSAGTCSTCSVTFANAQDFYEHLDDCVLRVVQQIDPAEGINHKNLSSIAEDAGVKATLDRHNLSGEEGAPVEPADEDDDEDEEELEADDAADGTGGSGGAGGPGNRVAKRPRTGLTLSKGGVTLHGPAMSGRKKRRNYPASWGSSAEKMKMKKRVLCVYDGPRRLWKDDMMMDGEYEVRVALPGGDGRAYVTDLDVRTLERAVALHGATEEERGPWVPDNVLWDEGEGW